MSDYGYCPICHGKIISRTPGPHVVSTCVSAHTFISLRTNVTRLDCRLAELTGEIQGLKEQLAEMKASRDYWQVACERESRLCTEVQRMMFEADQKRKGNAK